MAVAFSSFPIFSFCVEFSIFLLFFTTFEFDYAARTINYINGYKVNFSYVYTDEASSKNPRKSAETVGIYYKVKSYPNIRMYYNGKYMHKFKGGAGGRNSVQHYKAYLDILVGKVIEIERKRGQRRQ